MKESDLYLPLKRFLEAQGYEVKGEVMDCDVMAVRGDEEPLLVELKLSLNLSVLLQVVERLSLSSKVYIGVPRNVTVLKKKRKQILKLLRMLGLGLVRIDHEKDQVEIVLDPTEYKPRLAKRKRERLLGEFAHRVGDPNLGGTAMKQGIVTFYRQQALSIVEYLNENGATKASIISKALEDPKVRNILYRNVYGWFENEARGIYQLSPKGVDVAQSKASTICGKATSQDS